VCSGSHSQHPKSGYDVGIEMGSVLLPRSFGARELVFSLLGLGLHGSASHGLASEQLAGLGGDVTSATPGAPSPGRRGDG
jgi:hypothetical protein